MTRTAMSGRVSPRTTATSTTTSGFASHVTDVPGLSRNEQLKALGNGVVPHQAYAALTMMADRTEMVA